MVDGTFLFHLAQVHTPLITAADCEGAGEMFQVTTMMMDAEKEGKPLPMMNGKATLKCKKLQPFISFIFAIFAISYCFADHFVLSFENKMANKRRDEPGSLIIRKTSSRNLRS